LIFLEKDFHGEEVGWGNVDKLS